MTFFLKKKKTLRIFIGQIFFVLKFIIYILLNHINKIDKFKIKFRFFAQLNNNMVLQFEM